MFIEERKFLLCIDIRIDENSQENYISYHIKNWYT